MSGKNSFIISKFSCVIIWCIDITILIFSLWKLTRLKIKIKEKKRKILAMDWWCSWCSQRRWKVKGGEKKVKQNECVWAAVTTVKKRSLSLFISAFAFTMTHHFLWFFIFGSTPPTLTYFALLSFPSINLSNGYLVLVITNYFMFLTPNREIIIIMNLA